MASTTPRLGLYKPADDGSELVNVATDLNDNLERIDSAVGITPSTVATPPVAPYDGMMTYQTDTSRVLYNKAGTWMQILAKGASFLSNLWLDSAYRIGIGTGTPGAIVDVAVTSVTAAPLMKYKAFAEANPRTEIAHDGVKFGGGTATYDATLMRTAAGQISLTGSMGVSGGLTVAGATAVEALSAGNTTIDGTLGVSGTLTADTGFKVGNDFVLTGKAGFTTISLSAQSSKSTTVSFGKTFPVLPHVFVNLNTGAGATASWAVRAISVTTTGFTIFAYGPASATFTASVDWVAIIPGS